MNGHPWQEVQKQEQALWEDMRSNWEYIDKIYATTDEFDRFKKMSLSEKEMEAPLEALFKQEKRMFLEDISFIIVRRDELRRIIFLNYLRENVASLTVFDRNGDLVGKLLIRVKGDTVSVHRDKKNPIGWKRLRREAAKITSQLKKSNKPYLNVSQNDIEAIANNIERQTLERVTAEMADTLNFVLAAIHHVLNTTEIRKVSDGVPDDPEDEEDSDHLLEERDTTPGINRHIPKKLRRIIYEGRRPDKQKKKAKKEYTQRVDSWKVRGHWRIYSSGQTVWVKPHIRGRQSDKYRPKGTDYRL